MTDLEAGRACDVDAVFKPYNDAIVRLDREYANLVKSRETMENHMKSYLAAAGKKGGLYSYWTSGRQEIVPGSRKYWLNPADNLQAVRYPSYRDDLISAAAAPAVWSAGRRRSVFSRALHHVRAGHLRGRRWFGSAWSVVKGGAEDAYHGVKDEILVSAHRLGSVSPCPVGHGQRLRQMSLDFLRPMPPNASRSPS